MFLVQSFLLPAQSLVNNGAAIVIQNGAAIKLNSDYINQQNGRIQNAGTINLDGDWIQNSTAAVFLPTTGGQVKITGLGTHMIGGSYYPVFPSLKIETNVFLDAPTYIGNQLDINLGTMRLVNNDLILFSGAIILGGDNSHFIKTDGMGTLQMSVGSSPVNFPVGTLTDFVPVTLTNHNLADDFSVRVFHDVLDNGLTGSSVSNLNQTVMHTWVINDADGNFGSIDYDVQLQWDGFLEGGIFDRNNCTLTQYKGTAWQMEGIQAASGSDPYSLQGLNQDMYGAYTVQSGSGTGTNILFVVPGGAGYQNGTSWANASPSPQTMMDIAVAGQQVWVASGTYYPETNIPSTSGDRYKSFQSRDNISIYGGFAGNEDPVTFDLSLRDFITHETVLSGDVGVIGDSLDNCYHVFYLEGIDNFILDGLTIEQGFAYNNYSDPDSKGAGIYSYMSTFQLKNSIIRNNTGRNSGSIWSDNSGISISQTDFINNKSASYNDGGAIKSWISNITIDNCDFLNNWAWNYGGALKFSYGDLSITNCSFSGNYGGSGGVAQIDGSSSLLISNCNFTNNSTYLYGGALDFGYNVTSGLIEDCTFSGNSAIYQGGAINIYHATLNINRCSFTGNNGGGAGGAIYYLGATPISLCNSVISGNTAGIGGGLHLFGSGSFRCSNVVIAQNNGTTSGGGVFMQLSPKFFNTILWENTSPNGSQVHIQLETSEPQFHYCNVQGGKESFGGSGSGANYNFDYDNAFNINADPQFTNPVGNDFSVSSTSPCINSGVPLGTSGSAYPYLESSGTNWILYYNGGSLNIYNTDLALNPRIFDGNIDMGAYEFQQAILHLVVDLKVFLEGPFNGTNMNAGINDLSLLPLSHPYNIPPWNYPGTESVASIPNNQVVDWVLIEGRDAPDAASATETTSFVRQAAFLLSNGKIVDLDGVSLLSTNYSLNNNLFVVIWHRNHLPILSQFL